MSSRYLQIVDSFSRRYSLSFVDKVKLLLIYPFYKIIWFYLSDSKKIPGIILKKVVYILPHLNLNFKLSSMYNQKIILPISLEPSDFDAFNEIFWRDSYPIVAATDGCKTFLDVGANTGMCSFYFLANLPLQKMTLVEANPNLYKLLKKRFSKQTFPELDLEVINGCVSDTTNQKIQFKVVKNHRNSKIASDEEPFTHILPTLAFDNLPDADILKLDIEGEEFNLLEKFPQKFLKFKVIFIQLHGPAAVRLIAKNKFFDMGFINQTITTNDNWCEIVVMSKV